MLICHNVVRHEKPSLHTAFVRLAGSTSSHHGDDAGFRAQRGPLCGHIREHGAHRRLVCAKLHIRGRISAVRREAAACLPGGGGELQGAWGERVRRAPCAVPVLRASAVHSLSCGVARGVEGVGIAGGRRLRHVHRPLRHCGVLHDGRAARVLRGGGASALLAS